MIGPYLVDSVDLVDVAPGDDWGAPTTTTVTNVPARVESKVRLIRDREGKEVVSDMRVIMETSVTLTYNTHVRVKTVGGVAFEAPDKLFSIKRLARGHGFSNVSWEVWL